MVNPLVSIISQVAPTGTSAAGATPSVAGAGAAGLLNQGGLLAGNPFIQLLLSQTAQTQVGTPTSEGTTTAGQLIAGLTSTTTTGGADTPAAQPGADPEVTAPAAAQVGYGQAIAQLVQDLQVQGAVKKDGALQVDTTELATQKAASAEAQPSQTPAQGNVATGLTEEESLALQQLKGFDPALAAAQIGQKDKPEAALTPQVVQGAPANNRFEALKKAFQTFEAAENVPSATADKSALPRAVQAYGGQTDGGSGDLAQNDDGLTFGLFKQPPAQAGSSESGVFLNNLAYGGKTEEPLSSAAVAAKNPVPNSLSQNPTAAEQVSLRIAHAVKTGESSITLKLDPAELGQVEVKLNLSDGKHGTVQVTADRPETLQMLKGDARMLERALNDAGIKTDSGSLSFNLRGDGGGQGMQFSDYQAGQQQRGFEAYGQHSEKLTLPEESATVQHYQMNLADGVVDIMV